MNYIIRPQNKAIGDILRRGAGGELVHYLKITADQIEIGAKSMLLQEELLYVRASPTERLKLIHTAKPDLADQHADGAETFIFASYLTKEGEAARAALNRGLVWNARRQEIDFFETERMFREEMNLRSVHPDLFPLALLNDEPALAQVRRDLVFYKLKATLTPRGYWVAPPDDE